MGYLNLSKGFNPLGVEDSECYNFESFIFSGGEPHIKIDIKPNRVEQITITTRLNSMNDLGLLMVAVDALKSTVIIEHFALVIPYFPGARQDRRMQKGEPLTAKIYADIINAMEFDHVLITDAHSDVTPALLKNCDNVPNHFFINHVISLMEDKGEIAINPYEETASSLFNLISPDAGSNKKIKDLAVYLSDNYCPFNIVKCDKTRNTVTGRLTGFEVYSDDLKGLPCIIVDDICDGGGTFIGLAKELKKKNAGNLYLVVTHGIFSKGTEELKKYFKHMYTTDSIRNVGQCTEITEIKFKDIV